MFKTVEWALFSKYLGPTGVGDIKHSDAVGRSADVEWALFSKYLGPTGVGDIKHSDAVGRSAEA